MSSWFYLMLAVVTNVSANFLFKTAMLQFPKEITAGTLLRFAFNPNLLLGAICCAVLLASYLMALRQIELAVSYAFVISLSLVGIAVLSPIILDEPLRFRTLAGAALVIAGILVITLSSRSAPDLAKVEPRTEEVGTLRP